MDMQEKLWHVTDEGEVKKCDALKGRCPFARGNFFRYHFDSEEKAQEFVAITMQKRYGKFSTVKNTFNDDKHEVDLKLMDADDLALNLINLAPRVGISKNEMSQLIRITTFLHFGQRRRNRGKHASTPYIEHPLRVATRLVRAGIKEPVIIKAAVLHDTIEDGSKIFSENFGGNHTDENEARKELAAFLVKNFGKETVDLVWGLTNEIPETNTTAVNIPLTRRQKYETYLQKVKEEIADNDKVAVVKCSDFMDNAGSLHHTDLPKYEKVTFNQACKYKPLCEVIKNNIERNPHIPENTKKVWIDRLTKIERTLDTIIDKYKDEYEHQLDQ